MKNDIIVAITLLAALTLSGSAPVTSASMTGPKIDRSISTE
ncbi:hypothetical protein [Pseudomonas aeruginosa]|nr:hypothetical protein [Pseudomonas aeruginosa]